MIEKKLFLKLLAYFKVIPGINPGMKMSFLHTSEI